MHHTQYLVVLSLAISSISFTFAHPQGGVGGIQADRSRVSNVAAQHFADARVEAVKLSPKGGHLRFMHKGNLLTGDMATAKVFRMSAGKRVDVARSDWNRYLKPKAPIRVTFRLTNLRGNASQISGGGGTAPSQIISIQVK